MLLGHLLKIRYYFTLDPQVLYSLYRDIYLRNTLGIEREEPSQNSRERLTNPFWPTLKYRLPRTNTPWLSSTSDL